MLHNARHAYATLTLCALTLGFAPRPRVSRCTQLRLSPDREELRKLRVKELYEAQQQVGTFAVEQARSLLLKVFAAVM